MVFKMFNLVTFIILFSLSTSADEIPTLFLKEGTNKITLSILNNWNKNITNIKVMVDKEKLPTWLNVHEGDQKIDIIRGERSSEKIVLIFEVTNPSLDTFAKINLTLKDNKGNKWNFNVNVNIDSNEKSIPLTFDALYENFPNPFNPTTTIKYSLKENKHTKLVIYNSLGQIIRTLVNDKQDAGIHTMQWNGRDDNDKQVSSGLYFYYLKAGSFVKTRRMMLLE